MLCALVTSGTVGAGASTVQTPGASPVTSPRSNAGRVESNTTGPRPAWGDVESPFASTTKPNTYGAVTGYNPVPQACGNASYATVYNAMRSLVTIGVGEVRCDLNWWTVQPNGPTTYTWTIYDNVVNAAAANGLQVLFNVSFTPPWARPNPLPPGTQDPSHVPPKHTNDFVRFAQAAMQRYSPKGKQRPPNVVGTVSQWEIWNEPNIVGGWTPPNPVVYGTFLKNVVFGMRKVDHTATIISGGLAPAGDVGGNYSPQDFVAGMATTGVLTKIDGVGMHPYSFPAYPNEQLNFNPIYNAVPATYYVMLLNGAGAKKIWATEVGWPTSSQSTQSYRFWDGIQVGTEAYQAKELPLTISTWFQLPYVGPLFLYAQQDKCTDNTQWLCKMGIQRTDGSHKPAYATVQAQLRKTFVP